MIETLLLATVIHASPAIKINNVCLHTLPGLAYGRSEVADFTLVDVSKGAETVFTVYVGHNPDLMGTNVRYTPGAYSTKHSPGEVIRLGPPQDGDILGVPQARDGMYFHIILHTQNPENMAYIKSVRFC